MPRTEDPQDDTQAAPAKGKPGEARPNPTLNPIAIDVRQLHYFAGVAEAGSISKAARRLHITQSALSKRIADLEHAVHCPLLHRGTHGVQLTDQGQVLHAAALRILNDLRVAVDDVASMQAEPVGTVTLGCARSLAGLLSAPLYRELQRHHPKLHLNFVEAQSREQVQRLASGQIDIAILSEEGVAGALQPVLAVVEQMFLVEARAPGASVRAGPVSKEQLQARVFAMSSSGASALMLVQIEQVLGFRPRVAAEIDSLSGLRHYVREGLGCAILPWSAVHEDAEGGTLVLRRMAGVELTSRHSVCVSSERPLSCAARAVLATLEQLMRRMLAGRAWRHARIEAQG